MTTTSTSNVDYLYKETYQNDLADAATRMHPTTNMIKKEGKFNGTKHLYSVRYGNPQGIGSTVALAQAAVNPSKGVKFEAERAQRFGICHLDGDSMSAAEGQDGALLDLLTEQMDGMLDEIGDANGFDFMAGSGNGIRGQRLSAATNVITLTDAHTARAFKVNMLVGAASNIDGVTGLRAGSTTVAAVNIAANTITLTSAAAITSFADADYLFRVGDPGTCVDGFENIIPLTAPVFASDSFRGIDRGAYPELLAGSRLADTGYLPEDAAGYVATLIGANANKKPDCCALNPITFHNVARRSNAKREYMKGSSAEIGFEHITVWTAGGPLKVYPDPDVPLNRGRVMKMDSWCWKHLDGYIHVIQKDGLVSMRLASDDGVEIRHKCSGNIKCKDPAANGTFQVAA